jgi:endonuclease YncB( thermonuclease family)
VLESFEQHKGSAPSNLSKVFPEIIVETSASFVRLVILLDTGRKISNYDYALKSSDGVEKYPCLAVSDSEKFDSENWQIGPFEEKKKVSMLFLVPLKKIENNDNFLLSFDLPIGYEVPDVTVSLTTKTKSRSNDLANTTKIAEQQPPKNTNIEDTQNAPKSDVASSKNVVKNASTTENNETLETFTAKIEKISVNPKSFTFYVRKENGDTIKLCPYGIVPAEDEKLQLAINKALNTKYGECDISVKITGTDRYKRSIAKLYIGTKYVNKEMIEEGFAFYSWKYAPNDAELQNVEIKTNNK